MGRYSRFKNKARKSPSALKKIQKSGLPIHDLKASNTSPDPRYGVVNGQFSRSLTIDTMFYPTYTSFPGDIINTGLALICILGVINNLFFTIFHTFTHWIILIWSLFQSIFFHQVPVCIFLMPALFWDTCRAIS